MALGEEVPLLLSPSMSRNEDSRETGKRVRVERMGKLVFWPPAGRQQVG